MSTSRTTTTTIPQPRVSTLARPADPPMPDAPADEDEDSIMREALARVERVKARKAEEAQRRAEEEEAARVAEELERQKKAAAARRQAAQDARNRAIRAQEQESEVAERRKRLVEAATSRSRRDTSTGGTSASLRRPIVEVTRMKNKGKGKASAQAGKRSSVICKPCHDSKVKCSYSGRPYVVKKEGGANPSGERIAVLESQMAQVLADNRALREANSKSHQYLRQLLRRQEDDHARLISMDTRMALLGMGEGPATAGPSRRTTERRQPLKQRRIIEESEEEEEEEREVGEEEKEVDKDGEGEEEKMGEEDTAPTAARSDKGKGRAEE
ncbi:MAG: hypothetical protein NXY57DRAFT_969845 [Lentinula lateritia]|nr:MAG: hypothetical protein NXY57DRAFT_969845 [Lentinula lateritia]